MYKYCLQLLGEDVEDNSCTVLGVDSVIDVKLVDCEMTVVETDVMVKLVTDVVVAGGTDVLERVVASRSVITVNVGSDIASG